MSNDIVKQIIFKIKGDTRDVEKTMKTLTTSMSSFDKKGSVGKSITDLTKQFQSFSKTAGSMNTSMTKDFTKLSKVVEGIAKNNLVNLEKQFNQATTRMDRRLQIAERVTTKSGASAATIAKANARAGSSVVDATQAGNAWQEQQSVMQAAQQQKQSVMEAAQQQKMNNLNMGVMVATAAVTAVSTLMKTPQMGREAERKNIGFLGGQLQQRRFAQYNGDVTEMAMQQVDQSVSKSREFAKEQTKSESRSKSFWAGLGGIGVVGGAAALGYALTDRKSVV